MTFSDSRIANMLKQDFIPVWEAVAPVRTVTFDLGEGRSLKGSVSGEIAIYFCDTDGKVFDILPALQSPAATLKAMKTAKEFHKEFTGKLIKQKEKQKKYQMKNTEVDLRMNYFRYRLICDFQKNRLKKIAADRYDLMLKMGVKILKNPIKMSAKDVFPKSAEGEKIRDMYIESALDKATRDMRRMAKSKTMYVGPKHAGKFTDGAMTVVEPGGKGYYQWKIAQGFHGMWEEGNSPAERIPLMKNMNYHLMTPTEWKISLFEGIFKQELKGGEVEYDSESLKAINLFDE